MSSNVKVHEVDWKIIYNFVYVFHRNISHIIHHSWDISPNITKVHIQFKQYLLIPKHAWACKVHIHISDLENNI